ncbi:MAG: protein-disulfide reductase DsbD domain-containing protein [Planctomycetota bacterium]|nr:protein-disulfide reductase DsbD domain-containing protein [Planctomycetota bacterium]
MVHPFPALVLVAGLATAAAPPQEPPTGIGGFSFGTPAGEVLDGSKLVRMDVLADRSIVRPGDETLLGVRFRITPKWHIYWRNPGDSGTAPSIRVSGLEGLETKPIRWPRPMVFEGDWDTTYGYEEEVVLLVPVRIPASAPDGTVDLEVEAEWLVCKEACLLGDGRGVVSIEVDREAKPRAEARGNPAIATSSSRLPEPLAGLEGGSARLEGGSTPDRLVIEGPAGPATAIRFIPDLTPGVTAGEGHPVDAVISDGKFRIEVPLSIEPDNSLGQPLEAAGLVLFGPRATDPARSVRLPIAS